MSRLARKNLQTPFLHIMVQGINKDYIFSKNEYIETYLKIIRKYREQFPVTIISYCIMSNHAHLLVYIDDIQILGKFMHIVNLIYSQFYNKANNRCGVIFRNKYKVEPIYTIKHLINCINYIHLNPVKAKMVKNCIQYQYSSYTDYLNNTGICKNPTMNKIFGDNFDFSSLINLDSNNIFIDIDSPSQLEILEQMDKRID